MELKMNVICARCDTMFEGVGTHDSAKCPNCGVMNYVDWPRFVKCGKCEKEFILNGDDDYFACPHCKFRYRMHDTSDQDKRMIVVTCLNCRTQFKTDNRLEYTFCPRCGHRKQLKFNYRHFANKSSSSSSGWGGGRETDYFDSDMEGAPGFNGW